ncbi:metallophosphoesterase [Actinopolymorpha sp. NPDC004070]|uniref:metallophosphoesterase n=1 Tax=Actinopolymorpha sp. NPDC004070 TaxID=3154548 RepID=UPI0033AB865C
MRPADLAESSLGFARRQSVRWLAPRELWRAAAKVVISEMFGAYADKRELQGTFDRPLLSCQPDADELWLDFVADLGDGFDATYTIAWLLAHDKLDVAPAGERGNGNGNGGTLTLPRSALLLMGGDEVYPTASTREYEDRTKGPYRAALPEPAGPGEDAPMLVALPGNHDWYDGLTSFLRVFCQGRATGGWQTSQPRSYFAVRLPQRWWLVGVDIQLEGYVDEPQLRFFAEQVRPLLRPGDGVVVATGKPSWVDTATDPDAFATLDYLQRQLLGDSGAQVRLWVSGDSHHYVRYAERDGSRQMVTCGLGGAYLSATHDLPEALEVPPERSRAREKSEPLTMVRADSAYPDQQTSRRLGRQVWDIPWRNSGLAGLAAVLQGGLLVVLVAALALTTRRSPVAALRAGDVGDVLGLGLRIGLVVAAAVVVDVAFALVRRRRPVATRPLTTLAAAEVVLALVVLAGLAAVPLPGGVAGLVAAVAAFAAAVSIAGIAGVELFAAWLYAYRDLPVARGWIFSGRGIEDHKGFLRMHIGRDGTLTVHPVVVDRVCRSWKATPDAEPSAAWIAPAGEPPVPRLAEPPFRVPRQSPREERR